jgi:NTE family protein
LSDRKPHLVTKNKTDSTKLCDYIVASTSCFPALEMKEIDGDKYIDGAYYDNLPINLAVDMGADEVVAIDLESIGIKRDVKNKDIKVTYIRPSCDLGSFLVFDKNTIRKNMRLGYNDTMKAFKELDGDIYTFKKNDLEKNYKKYGEDFSYIAKRMIGINNKRIINQLSAITFYKRLIKNSFNDKKTMDKSLELLGEIFELPNYKIYDISLYNHMLKMKFDNYDDKELININHLKKLNFDKVINHKHIVKSIYTYMLKPVEYHKELSDLSVLFPKEFMGALYLYTIN